MKANNILETIGNTPHVKINNLFGDKHRVWIKLERDNPGNSIKDRVALEMIEDAEREGLIKKGSTIIEPTSGNTGVGLSLVAAVKGYRVVLVMPDSMSIERRKIMSAYGALIELTPREKGMKGAIERAFELTSTTSNSWIPMQFSNVSNSRVHERTTATEIINDFPEGIDYLVTGVGTGGHITGVGKMLKKIFPHIQIIAVEPEQSPVLSGGEPGLHPIQGIGAGFIPEILDLNLIDRVVKVSAKESFEYTRLLAQKEGIFAGISTGASMAATAKIIGEIKGEATIMTFNYDTGERYLSVENLF